jgi:orotate phosphoribosyltransferase
MTIDLIKSLFIDMAVILTPLAAGVLYYLWIRQRETNEMLKAVREVALKSSEYEAVHAGRIPDYFDADLFLCDPKQIEGVVRWFKEELERQRELGVTIDRLAFIEKREGPVGALTLKDLLSLETRVPTAILRPRRKGPAPRIKGLSWNRQPLIRFDRDGRSERVAIVSDVGTTGTTILEAVDMVEAAGGRVEVALVLYDRTEGAAKALEGRGMSLIAMAGPQRKADAA